MDEIKISVDELLNSWKVDQLENKKFTLSGNMKNTTGQLCFDVCPIQCNS